MGYTLVYHRDIPARDLPAISRNIRDRIARAIESRLGTAPERYGHPLRGSLKGYWKLRVGDLRVVYKIVGSEVWILGIAHRRDVYARMEKRAE
jgi:mRNA interferase RelE/StbE